MAKTVKRSRELKYTGKVIQHQKSSPLGTISSKDVYLANSEIIDAVNLSIFLERPLLIKGEPGSGKTRLARAVANELQLPLETWYVKSTSKAKDGLYTFDFVGRLRDAQLASTGFLKNREEVERIQRPETYIRLGPLGKSFVRNSSSVVLIDEIDKADIDFPNDLLIELDEKKISIEETGKVIQAKFSPIIIITSNDEKELSDAFLRRCVFHYIEFPSEAQLIEIIKAHFPNANRKIIEKATHCFLDLRNQLQEARGRSAKNVSTSELLDWFHVLQRYPNDKVISMLDGKLPHLGVLLKNWDDHLRYYKESYESAKSKY